jgi:hypothetical protein
MLRKFLLFIILAFSTGYYALSQEDTTKPVVNSKISLQDLDYLHSMEDSLLITIDSVYNAYIPDTREEYCAHFIRQLVKALKIPKSYYYPFDKLEKKIYIIYPDDKSFRIFHWYTSLTQPTRRYYGAIQMQEDDLKLYPLVDYSEELGKYAADSLLTGSKWFGAQYYRIITHTVGGQKVYTLFGMNAGSAISNKKVMDPLTFTESGPVFGAQVFDVRSETNPGQLVYRFILEYKKQVQVSLNWDNELNCVYFDKLISQMNDPNRKYTFVPSGAYDGFRWEDEMWRYKKDLIPIQNLGDDNAPGGDKPFNSK